MDFTRFDRAFMAGVAVAHMLSPELRSRIVEALREPESARQARVSIAAALSHKDPDVLDAALDALFEAVVARDASGGESHDDGHQAESAP